MSANDLKGTLGARCGNGFDAARVAQYAAKRVEIGDQAGSHPLSAGHLASYAKPELCGAYMPQEIVDLLLEDGRMLKQALRSR